MKRKKKKKTSKKKGSVRKKKGNRRPVIEVFIPESLFKKLGELRAMNMRSKYVSISIEIATRELINQFKARSHEKVIFLEDSHKIRVTISHKAFGILEEIGPRNISNFVRAAMTQTKALKILERILSNKEQDSDILIL